MQPKPDEYLADSCKTDFEEMIKSRRIIINCVGVPPQKITETGQGFEPGLASSAESALINRIAFPPPNGKSVDSVLVDTIEGDQEDPFTLDTFESLAKNHMEQGKDFILARVITQDECTQKLFYNFYAAHHINKVLFRTQPEEGLLHRMKAKNPMNNMMVVGDVHYYVIRFNDGKCNPLVKSASIKSSNPLTEVARSQQVRGTRSPPSPTNSIKRSPSLPIIGDSDNNNPEMLIADSVEVKSFPEKVERRPSLVSDSLISRPPEDSIDNEKLTQQNQPSNIDDPLVFTARLYSTDDDYLMKRYVREYFKKNALNAEDIFLFTLFGGQGTNVSDPTDPSAVALSLEDALYHYRNQTMSSTIISMPNSHSRLNFWHRIRAPNWRRFTLGSSSPGSPRATPDTQRSRISNFFQSLFQWRPRVDGTGDASNLSLIRRETDTESLEENEVLVDIEEWQLENNSERHSGASWVYLYMSIILAVSTLIFTLLMMSRGINR